MTHRVGPTKESKKQSMVSKILSDVDGQMHKAMYDVVHGVKQVVQDMDAEKSTTSVRSSRTSTITFIETPRGNAQSA